MSDDVKHSEDDLGPVQPSTEGDDVKHSDEADDSLAPESTKSNEPTPAQQKAVEAQKQGLLKKIKAGELTLEDVKSKKDIAWLASDLEKALNTDKPVAKISEEDIKAEARAIAQEEAKKVLQQEREDAKFSSMKEQYLSLGLNASEMNAVNADFQDMKDKLGRVKAMEVALKMHNITLDEAALNRRAMAIDLSGSATSTPRKTVSTERQVLNQADMPRDELAKVMAQRLKGR